MFKPFFTLDPSRNKLKGESGLGLSITRDIIRSHGGEIKIDKSKFLVPQDITIGQFMTIIRKRIILKESEAFYIFVKNEVLPSNSTTIANIYDSYKNDDGFLYMTYCGENVFGC